MDMKQEFLYKIVDCAVYLSETRHGEIEWFRIGFFLSISEQI